MEEAATPIEQLNTFADKDADTVDSDVRYMAYAARLRTAVRAGSRYVAYVSPSVVEHACSDKITRRPVTLGKRSVRSSPLR